MIIVEITTIPFFMVAAIGGSVRTTRHCEAKNNYLWKTKLLVK